jgi:hypothetical protein
MTKITEEQRAELLASNASRDVCACLNLVATRVPLRDIEDMQWAVRPEDVDDYDYVWAVCSDCGALRHEAVIVKLSPRDAGV